MKILVNGKEAVLKTGSSFEYVSENPLFTEAEGYSLEIEFPLKDCPQNILIFGALHVKGVDISTVTFPCEIITESFNKSGILTITEVNDASVKAQFLEGMSQENFASVLNSYINELDYGDYDGTRGGWSHDPSEWPGGIGIFEGWTQFEIWDKSSKSVLGPVEADPDGHDFLCRHIYLWKLVELVALVMPGGWSLDQENMKQMEVYEYAIIANRRNFIRNDSGDRIRPLNLSLPHWTVREFFNYVGDFFGFATKIDVNSRSISFVPYKDFVDSNEVELQVSDDFTVEIVSEESKYRGNRKYSLPDNSDPKKLNSCRYILDDQRVPHQTMTSTQFFQAIKNAQGNDPDPSAEYMPAYLYYLSDVDQYAVITECEKDETRPGRVILKADIINQCDSEEGGEELKLCPCPQGGEVYRYHDWPQFYYNLPEIEIPDDPDECYDSDAPWNEPPVMDRISSGQRKPEDFLFDKLWLVRRATNGMISGFRYKMQFWWTAIWDANGNVAVDDNGNQEIRYYTQNMVDDHKTLTPQDQSIKANVMLPKVDETKLYRYKFLASSLPSATAIYVIKGKRYACLRLTARFTDTGMSELIEGEFYEIVG